MRLAVADYERAKEYILAEFKPTTKNQMTVEKQVRGI